MNDRTAKAIVYAARQAYMINDYGMTWEAIETNTANILAGCSVPADGQMNSAEAVSNHVYDMLKRGLISPYEARTALVEPISPSSPEIRVALALVDNYHALKNDKAKQDNYVRELEDLVDAERQRVADEHGHMLTRCRERDEAHAERDKALEAMQIEATAAQEARKEALANRLDRDQFAAKWATLKGECHAQNQRANQAEKDNAELLRLLDAMREDLKGSELCRDQLRRDLESTGNELASIVRDRDGFRKGAQFWMDNARECIKERDAAEAKVVKLRTFLQGEMREYYTSHDGIENILEQTK